MTPTERVLAALPNAKTSGAGWQARCPAHEDGTASLSIATGDDDRALIHCHAGCSVEEIVGALGITFRDLMPPKAATPKPRIVASYSYHDEQGTHLFDVVRFAPKDFRQRAANGAWSMKGVRRVPFRLPDLTGCGSCFIVEGEKDADALAALGLPATCNPGGAGKWRSEYSTALTTIGITKVCILPDNDAPGLAHAESVAQHCLAAGIEVRMLLLPNLPAKGDVGDWLSAGGTRDELLALVKAAPLWGAAPHQSAPVCDTRTTPEVVGDPRPRRSGRVEKPKQGRAVDFEDVEPADEVVSGADLLDAVAATFRRYLALPEHAAVALALWALRAWCFGAAFCSPLLALTSPAKRCGKTATLVVLGALVPRRLFAANVTPAVLFRTIEKYSPTLLIDEADTFIKNNDELRGVINSGHTMTTAVVIRAVGDDHDPRAFSTWCPKAIALIGKLPDTLHDRAIEIRMRRRLPGETVERLRQDRIGDECLTLRQQAARWAADHEAELTATDPSVPAGLNDRASDSWRPLLAIADAAGGAWPVVARAAADALCGSESEDDTATQLLSDIREVFRTNGDPEAMGSTTIAKALEDLDDRPWREWSQGRPISAAKLTRLLTRHDVVAAGNIRIGDKVAKGYRRAAFQDAWDRYLPPQKPLHRYNANESGPEPTNVNRYTSEDCSGIETATNPMATGSCYGVAVSAPADGSTPCEGVADADRL